MSRQARQELFFLNSNDVGGFANGEPTLSCVGTDGAFEGGARDVAAAPAPGELAESAATAFAINPKDLDVLYVTHSVENAIEHIQEKAIKSIWAQARGFTRLAITRRMRAGDSAARCGEAERAAKNGEPLTRTGEEETPGWYNKWSRRVMKTSARLVLLAAIAWVFNFARSAWPGQTVGTSLK